MAQQTEFIPYEQALELKELGFDEECLDKYDPRFEKLSSDMQTWTTEHYPETLMIPAPLYQQAFRWFRDTKLSDACVCRYQSRDDGGIYFYYVINHDYGIEETRHFKEGFFSYEEAELACLKKLIEIVKQK